MRTHLFILGANPFSPWCYNKGGKLRARNHFASGNSDVIDYVNFAKVMKKER